MMIEADREQLVILGCMFVFIFIHFQILRTCVARNYNFSEHEHEPVLLHLFTSCLTY